MNNLQALEMKNQRVLTTQQLADGYGANEQQIQQNFNNHLVRFQEGKHFFLLQGEELKAFKGHFDNIEEAINVSKFASKLYLWTEKGALRHAKILDTEQAWEVYEKLEDTYFRVKQQSIDYSQLSPETQILNQMCRTMVTMELEQKKTHQMALEAKSVAETISEKVENIKETIINKEASWRDGINAMLNKIVKASETQNYQDIRGESYIMLESRGKCKLDIRLKNYRSRLFESGSTKTQIAKANKLDVIEDDPRLKEIYSAIVREMTVSATV